MSEPITSSETRPQPVPGGEELYDVKLVKRDPNSLTKTFENVRIDPADEMTLWETDGEYLRPEPVDVVKGPRYYQIGKPEDIASPLHGGQGVVRKMYDTRTRRIVAAKKADSHKEATLEEARRLAQFRHPNLVTIYDLAVTSPEQSKERTIYFITEWLEGNFI